MPQYNITTFSDKIRPLNYSGSKPNSCNNGPTTNLGASGALFSGAVRSQTGWRNPRWQETILKRGDATSEYTSVSDRISISPAAAQLLSVTLNCTVNPYRGPVTTYSTSSGSDFVVPSLPAAIAGMDVSIIERVQSGFNSKVYDSMTSWDSGVFIGELRETLQLIRSPFRAFNNLSKSYLAGVTKLKRPQGSKSARKKDITKRISDMYLQYNYGVIPLAADIDDATKAISGLNRKTDRKIIRYSDRSDYKYPDTTFTQGAQAGFLLGQPRVWSGRNSSSVRISVSEVCAIDTSIFTDGYRQRRDFGLTMSNFVPTVWNLIPYSFLIDYFSNVGNVLQSISIELPQMIYHTRSTKIVTQATRQYLDATVKTQLGSTITVSPGAVLRSRCDFSRIGLSKTRLVEPLRFEIPSIHQLINMAALGYSHSRASDHLLRLIS